MSYFAPPIFRGYRSFLTESHLETQNLVVTLDLHPEPADVCLAELPDDQGLEENDRSGSGTASGKCDAAQRK